jgi:hypothetical protein
MPEGINDVVLRRVARLREPAHEALTLAAVAGQTFSSAVLGTSDVVLDVLDEGLSTGLLTPTEQPDRLTFAHALIRQTLYGHLSETRRIRLHQRVAERLEGLHRRDAAELAHHWFGARHVAGPEPARELYALLEPYPTRFAQIGYAAGDGPVARSLGLLADATGRARAHLEHALALCAGAPALEVRGRTDLSQLR